METESVGGNRRQTGWYEQMEQVASIVEESGIGLIWSSNFSLGVNLFFRLVETAASMMNRFPQIRSLRSRMLTIVEKSTARQAQPK